MNLGKHFSEDERINFVERNLLPGHVIKLFCHTTRDPKEKRLVIVSLNPELLLFFINSEVPNFKQKSTHLRTQQIFLKAKDNAEFLEHDSWLDCSEVCREFTVEEIKKILLNDISRILGKLNDETISQLMDSVCDSETLEQRHINSILNEIK
ncbi:MAG: hypothetical protein LUM44_03945 [Pyrinomonadaceae bacterium]|nr:hypothetical protein [Pyrinomonadaceae bacterium]